MGKRLLIVSHLDSSEPFGAFTRPFYLGQYLVEHFNVCQLGLDCSSVDYAPSISVGSRSLKSYIKSIQKSIDEFHPDIIYAQETRPSLAALTALKLRKSQKCPLVLDFHTFSAYEYWSRLSSVNNRFQELRQCIKTYIAQGILVFSDHPIIAAGESTPKLISQWYGKTPQQICCIGNGVTEDLLNCHSLNETNPYQELLPAKIVVVVAPKTYGFPTNDMSVSMTIDIAKHLENSPHKVNFVVIGRNKDDIEEELPSNIYFTGFLPSRNDFISHIKYADIALLPFSQQAVAGGARNKALDYFASQKLVVSTPEGLRGLEEFRDRQHLLVTSYSTEDIAQTILDVALNEAKYQPLAQAAYSLIKEKYSWKARAQSITNVLLNAINS
ncbi:MAG: glycosyltransferase family 4 protein [Cyanobacteria bacterium P01_D01_bin.50]